MMLSPDGRWRWDGHRWWPVQPGKTGRWSSGNWSLGLGLGAVLAVAVPPIGVAMAVLAIVIGLRAVKTHQRAEALCGIASGVLAVGSGLYLTAYIVALFLGIVH